MDCDVIALHDGRVLEVHPPWKCLDEPCCIHNPSAHPLRHAPLYWREDRAIIERICPHGIGHPDPDDLTFRLQHGTLFGAGVHNCDGCCRPLERAPR